VRQTPLSRQLVRGLGLVTAALVLPVLAGCSGDAGTEASGTTGGTEVSVSASDTACTLSKTELAAGSTTFEVTNSGSKVTEVYVYGEADGAFTKVISEVENIGPGTSRDMTVNLSGGTYEIACKPGQTGDGIRATVTVAGGAGGAEASSSSEAAYDRELELRTDGASITGLDGASATVGEKIEFKLDNGADGTRTLEIKRPDGSVAGEVEIAAGAEGELVVELATAGQWQVIVEGAEPELQAPLEVR
jgi:uncharacterized cupredoxin-like copper-binding protein